MNDLISYYTERTTEFNKQIVIQKEKSLALLYVRLASLAVAIYVFLHFLEQNPFVSYVTIPVIITLFLILIKKEIALKIKINHLKNLIQVNEIEIDLLNNNFAKFDEGKEFINKQHDFVSDLDIFGMKSVFQLLNRTSTYTGRTKLAAWLTTPFLDKTEIVNRQAAIKDLTGKPEWCQNFIALGFEKKETATDKEVIKDWLNEKNLFSTPFYSVICLLLPLITILALALSIAGVLNAAPFFLLFLLQLMLVGYHTRTINHIHDRLSRRFYSVEKYVSLIREIETERFDASGLTALQSAFSNNDKKASTIIQQLKKLSDTLDARMNIFMAVALNGILLWDINVVKRLEKWRVQHKEDFLKWIDAIGEFDAFISLALYTFNHPAYSFPEVSTDGFVIHGEELGHPLISESKLVKNKYHLEGTAKVDLLTGANMAGKSTFLRTIGVNLVIAMIGAPVCAKTFRFMPIHLFTSLRTNDSLQENESFFYAELKRLRMMIQKYESGQKIFFLLDEILKGTNSKDQHAGSEALIKKILKLNGTGIIATHDVELSRLETEFPSNIRNQCFEIQIINDKLYFDYTVKPGVCRTMNASFLMKQMGIVD